VQAPEDAEEILVADLDPAAVAAARDRVPVLRHRRYAVVPLG
jgi:predicted amidohydrolase